jgi:hypothetical protein
VTIENVSRVITPPDGRVNGVQYVLVEDELDVGESIISQIARSSILKKRGATEGSNDGLAVQ